MAERSGIKRLDFLSKWQDGKIYFAWRNTISTNKAWKKMIEELNNTKKEAFLFSATGGGCNGFNYN